MQRKTVRIYSFSNSRSKDSYAQNFLYCSIQFKYQKLHLERCFIVNLDVLKSFNILELTYKRICSILKIILKIV